MHMFPLAKHVVFIATVCTQLSMTSACGRGAVYIMDNEYHQVLIAISETVPENPSLLSRIKEVFTAASARLYQATNKRAYFGDITILVPKTWTPQPEYEPLSNETLDNSDVVIDEPDPTQADPSRPFVIKTTPCGELGLYMHLTPEYLLDANVAEPYGEYDKVIVHEWAHLRYGVFDEYPDEGTGTHFYAATNGEIEATRCSATLTGSIGNPETGGGCRVVNGLVEEDCRFEDRTFTGDGFGSLMYKTLSHIDSFCDDDPSNGNTFHNREAPTKQNQMCAGQSIWEVLRSHSDFADNSNPPVEVASTEPRFRLVQSSTKRTVLVLDVSGSMDNNDRAIRQNQASNHFLSSVMEDGEYIGIVQFSGSAVTLLELTLVESDRSGLVNSLPTSANGATSIGSGVLEALAVLERGGGTTGGTIIIVSDGEENTYPAIEDIWDTAVTSGVTVHTIAFTWQADSSMDDLAQATGGLVFLYSDLDTSNALNDAFQTIGELNQNPMQQSYTISSEAWTLAGRAAASYSAVVDATLGKDTEITFDFGQEDGISISLRSPSGSTYDDSSAECSLDTVYRTIRCLFPGLSEIGRWEYDVTSIIDESQRLAVTVKSKSSSDSEYPIIAHAFWGTRKLNFTNAAQNIQRLYASVSKGYSAVLNAEVMAEVETPSGSIVNMTLLDNGAGADLSANDGVYSAYFIHVEGDGRYNVKVLVNSNEATEVSPEVIVGASGQSSSGSTGAPSSSTGEFERQATGGSFETVNFVEGALSYPPGQITDLSVVAVDAEANQVTLTWTAQGSVLDTGTASMYKIHRGDSYNVSHSYYVINDDDIISGGNLTSPRPCGEQEVFIIQLPSEEEQTYFFAVFSRDLNGRDENSTISNIVSCSTIPVRLPYKVQTYIVLAALMGSIGTMGLVLIQLFIKAPGIYNVYQTTYNIVKAMSTYGLVNKSNEVEDTTDDETSKLFLDLV